MCAEGEREETETGEDTGASETVGDTGASEAREETGARCSHC